jgi:shikimate dehydrogenase
MRRFGLIGYPLGHSFSQHFFAEKFAKEGISDSVYENYPIADISELGKILEQSDLRGLNVTIPYKKQVLPFLTHSSYAVSEMGACNCIDIRDGKLTGHNTDTFGFEKSLLPFLHSYHNKALVLGTGGASAAVIYVLQKLHIDYQYVSRSREGNAMAYDDITPAIMNDHLLIINTTPLGMYPNIAEFPAIPYELLTNKHHLFDLVYNPAETVFLSKGKAHGATVQNGEQMLILQAEESWRIWNS